MFPKILFNLILGFIYLQTQLNLSMININCAMVVFDPQTKLIKVEKIEYSKYVNKKDIGRYSK